MSNDLENTLQERGARYGTFLDNARISQRLKEVMRQSANWERLSEDKKECLDQISAKISRLLTGDPEYHDSWHDMSGYSKLVADTLVKK